MKTLHIQNSDMRKLSWTYANNLSRDYFMSPFFWFSTVFTGPEENRVISKSTFDLAFKNIT